MSFGIIVCGVILSLMFTCCFIPFGVAFIVLYYWLSDKIMTFIFKNNPELCKNIYIILFIIVLIATILGILGLGVYCGFPEVALETAEWSEPYNYITHQIVNFSDNNEINGYIRGNRYYVRGYIGEETIYHYYYQQYDSGFKLQKASEKNTTIYFTDGEPRAEWYSQTRTFWWKSETKYFCKIYIPEGSMMTEFKIDME